MEFISDDNTVTGDKREERESINFLLAGAMVLITFFICRVMVFEAFFPCGIAMLTVLMRKNRMYVYLLPAMIVSMATHVGNGVYLWGDFAAIMVCTIIFVVLGGRRVSLFLRMMIAGAAVVVCNFIYFFGAHIFYRFSPENLLLEVILIFCLGCLFDICYQLTISKRDYKGSAEGGVVALATLAMLLFCGLGVWEGGDGAVSHLPVAAGLILVLVLGYRMGIMEGVMAGAASAAVLALCTEQPPGVMVVFVCAGFVAGFSKGSGKPVTSIYFAAACLALGLNTAYPDMRLPIQDPLVAAGIFLILPRKLLESVDTLLVKLVKDESYYDYAGRGKILENLEGYRRSFDALASMYAVPGGGRTVVAHQFKGMSQVVSKMIMDIGDTEGGSLNPGNEDRFEVKFGEGGYAWNGGISGDSRLCRELPDGRFLMLLSDGMGKGKAAAMESGLAVTTLANLLEAGFGVEIAIKTVNSILLMKSEEEMFATVDIGIIDRKQGRMKLYKIGAASTFIKRKDKVEIVKAKTLPLGIVDGLNIDYVNVKLHSGDQIIMASDGITDPLREDIGEEWLTGIIASIKSKDPQTVCDLIINKTVEKYGLKERDDLTVITANIEMRS